MDSGIYRDGMKVELTLECRHFADRFSAKWILVLPIAPLWRSSMYVRIYLPPSYNIPQSVYKHGVLLFAKMVGCCYGMRNLRW